MRRLRRPSLRRRHLWLIPGLALAVYANGQAGLHGLGLAPVLIFGIVPHLPALLGLGQPHATGQLASRAIPWFNVMHHPVVPVALLLVAASGLLSAFWIAGGMAWLSHIVVDWAMGDGLRSPDGYVRERSIWSGRPFSLPMRPTVVDGGRS